MGKNMQHQDSNISLENGSPGCMYNILHGLRHQRWYRVKKMVPHKRHTGVKHTPGGRLDAVDVGEFDLQIDAEMANSLIEERMPESSPVTKTSMKSRIKAFVTEEVSKRRGRHRRSSSYPTRQQFSRTNSIHHLDPSDLDPLPEISSNGKNVGTMHQGDNENSSTTKKRRCDICAAMLSVNYLKQSNVNQHERQQLKHSTIFLENIEKNNHDLLEGKDEPSTDTSAQETKRLLEALDIFDMRKEFFLKMLHDPKSPWGQYLHSHQAFNPIKVLTKSVSFPASASARLKDPLSKQAEKKSQICCQSPKLSENGSVEECNKDGTSKSMLTRSGSSHELKSRNENKLVMMRFKNLRQKIRHAIKESRKERHRIVMDAVFHKVPYGRRSSKYAKDYESLDLKEKLKKHSPASSSESDQSDKACLRRAASYNETLNMYSRLFDESFNREACRHISERLKTRQTETPSPSESERATLGRILSLPDLRCSFFIAGEESPSMTPMNSALNVVSRKFNDRKAPGLSLVQETGSQENLVEEYGIVDKNNETTERASRHQEKVEPTTEMEKPSPVSVLDSNSRDDTSDSFILEDSSTNQQQEPTMDSPTMGKGALDMQKMASTPAQQCSYDFLRIPMDIKDNAEFKYVRAILTLAGFSKNEFLRTWHSTFQPVDPSVYEEVESCLLADPNFQSGEEEGQRSDHLLLFDLINDVLLEIHDRSFAYYPKPLTNRSHFHPMPMGYHVLEEVWNNVSWYLRYGPAMDKLLDDAVSRDLTRDDGWMNLQFDAECVGIEIGDMIFDDLLDELVWS